MSDDFLARLAVEKGGVSPEALRAAQRECARHPDKNIGDVLLDMGLVTRDGLECLLREQRFRLASTQIAGSTGAASAPSSPAEEKPFGKYRLLGELGRGGMGVVYKAQDIQRQTTVAIKCMLASDNPDEVKRFLREASTASVLDHPNIVKVMEVDEHDGTPYIAMEFIDGPSLGRLLRPRKPEDKRLTLREALGKIRDVARALGYAHRQGIVHRDIKPPNIMVDSSGRVRVMDFGLAREIARGATITSTGIVMGTPSYMSPEQAEGRKEAVDGRSDIWALGVMLYEVAAKQPPFAGDTPAEVLHRVVHEEPLPLRKRDAGIDVNLETIVMKCLEWETARRYATADQLADDIDHYLEGRPITARPPSLFHKLKRRLKKRRGVAIAVAAGVVAVTALAIILIPRLGRAQRKAAEAETTAESEHRRAERGVTEKAQVEHALKLWSRISNILSDAEIYRRSGDAKRAIAKLEEGVSICREDLKVTDQPSTRYFLGRFLHAQGNGAEALRELDFALELGPDLGEARLERGLLRVERYGARLDACLRSCHPPRTEENGASLISPDQLEDQFPDLRELRTRAIEDLTAGGGKSSYYKEVDVLFGQAELARLRGEFDVARKRLDEVLRVEPLYATAYVALARMAERHQDYAEALKMAAQALDKDRGLAAAYSVCARAHFWLAQGRGVSEETKNLIAASLEESEKAIAFGDRSAGARASRGSAYWANGMFDKSISDFDEAIRLEPVTENYVGRGLAKYDSGDLDGAGVDYDKALEIFAKNATAYANRGLVRFYKDNDPGAIADFDSSIRLQPENAFAYSNRSMARRRMGDSAGALEDCAKALQLDPNLSSAYVNRGCLQFDRGEIDRAQLDMESALRLNPRSAAALTNRSTFRCEKGDIAGALSDAESALKIKPQSSEARVSRGRALAGQGKLEDAIKDFTEALRLGPRNVDALINRGVARYRLNNLEGGLSDLDKAVEINPRSAPAFLNRGGMRRTKKDLDGALSDLDKALEIRPAYFQAYLTRGLTRYDKGDLKGAIEDYDKALDSKPGDAQVYNVRALAKRDKGDTPGAFADFGEAIRSNPNYPEAYVNRADLKRRLMDFDGAIEDYSKALDVAPPKWRHRKQTQDLLDMVKKAREKE